MRKARQTKRDAKHLWRLCLVNGSLDENRARLVVEQVIESRHTGKAAILSYFLLLLRLDRALHAAEEDPCFFQCLTRERLRSGESFVAVLDVGYDDT